ncbi:MAG: hypothetical protein OEX02_10685 [Cyclobacteriaceae bacterium]|nr:hypothetical protein [Cyclobacteriaceae bacterium]
MNLLKKLQYTVKRVAVGLMSIMLLSGASQQTEGSITTREKALEVIEKYIEATGGREEWSKLETMEFWHIYPSLPHPEGE